jgi:hypothetical protein
MTFPNVLQWAVGAHRRYGRPRPGVPTFPKRFAELRVGNADRAVGEKLHACGGQLIHVARKILDRRIVAALYPANDVERFSDFFCEWSLAELSGSPTSTPLLGRRNEKFHYEGPQNGLWMNFRASSSLPGAFYDWVPPRSPFEDIVKHRLKM